MLVAVLCAAFASPALGRLGTPLTPPLVQCIAPQHPGDTPARLFADPARFDCQTPAWRFGPGNYWVWLKAPPAPAVGTEPLYLHFVPQWQRSLAITSRTAAGHIGTRILPDRDMSQFIGMGAAVAVPLDGGGQPVTDVLIAVDGAVNVSGLIAEPQILPHEAVHTHELIATAIFAAFAGLGIGLLCYNIVVWLTIRERFQLTYCLSLLAMLAYVWASSGAMAEQFPLVPHSARLGTSYVMLAFVAALALQFIADFIEPNKISERLRARARQVGLGCVVAGLAVAVCPPQWRHLLDRIYVLTFVPLPPLVLAMTVLAWRRGSRSVRVLAIAWALPTAMAVVRILHALHLVPNGVLVQYSLVLAMSVEALLSSLAMSFRIKLITDERDRALADERAARHLASIDSLTGLLNRRALLERLIEWRHPEPLRMLLVDIDHFKQINDRHGHLLGDEVLREVAETLAMRADLQGTVARLGGEEFALVGTADDLHEGVALAILTDIRGRTMADGVRLTVSIGMAEGFVRCEDEWRELYRRADAALYSAKNEGRNRAVHAPRAVASSARPDALAVA